jgi:hypothetical protein
MPKWSNLTAKDLKKGIVQKLSLERTDSKRGREPIYWYLLDGKKQFHIAMPNIHGGSGSVSIGYLKQIRMALRLETKEFEDLANCPLKAKDYEKIIRDKLEI